MWDCFCGFLIEICHICGEGDPHRISEKSYPYTIVVVCVFFELAHFSSKMLLLQLLLSIAWGLKYKQMTDNYFQQDVTPKHWALAI